MQQHMTEHKLGKQVPGGVGVSSARLITSFSETACELDPVMSIVASACFRFPIETLVQ